MLWHVGVYCPLAHAMWHPNGFLHIAGVIDFAGGRYKRTNTDCFTSTKVQILPTGFLRIAGVMDFAGGRS